MLAGIEALLRWYDPLKGITLPGKFISALEETNLNESAEHTLTREAEALSRLQHPNVITLFAFEEDGRIYAQ